MTGNLDKDDVYLHLDTRFRDSGSIQNSRYFVNKIANVKAISVIDLQFFNIQYTIDSRNQKLYFNDGSARTATLTKGRYDGTTLATEVASAMNVVSSGYSCTFSDTTLKMTISNASAFTLTLSNTTSAIWNVLGFDTGTNSSSATSHTSDNLVKLSSKYYYITSNIVNSTHINDDLRDNILIIFGNTQNYGSLITRPTPQIIPASNDTIDYIKITLYDDEDNIVDCNGINFSFTLRFHRG